MTDLQRIEGTWLVGKLVTLASGDELQAGDTVAYDASGLPEFAAALGLPVEALASVTTQLKVSLTEDATGVDADEQRVIALVEELLAEPYFVPASTPVFAQLQYFQEARENIALVVDEYGALRGIVTLEDIIIEEIVGEINDEFDEVEADYKKIGDNMYVFEAKTSLNDFCRVFEIESAYFEKAKGESETLAGLIIELFGRIPSAGEEIEFEDFTFKVQSVDTRRIKKVRVTQRVSADQDDSQN